ncbi:2-polyprenyl-3-methyl-5-hydroxy-6-metoxy-1,4-benzoquinol methylase [Natronocella acetinitrilica]|uniref:2-polyprenyl-3-methyl-5-hydroxy-6-metoxy-1, 4-benzoquinol methylase n=1 Tax=Natronocella acetinitrilica TaxID=414046 RepID=A0AAE3G7A8_9GAMM|nr:2-polyprenyl-3-methyl-5-hydroxy-6-metoxy-1,4-benzoquinol methylase [Natronocella acetinitrilica]
MNTTAEASMCPLCDTTSGVPYASWRERRYLHCENCDLVWLDPAQRLNPAAERTYYATHENDPRDPGYRRFLSRAAEPLLARLAPGSHGLDYGCGPGPALAYMLQEAGHTMALYDPYFAPAQAALERQYDFVTCTETAEHFHNPGTEFRELDSLLRPRGWLAVMTGFRPEQERFANWHYVRDPTHVSFYSEKSLAWLAELFEWEMQVPAKNVVLFRKG